MKICTKCKISKEIIQFHKDKSTKDGLAYQCKLCAVNRAKNHYQENKEEKSQYQRNYYANNREMSLDSKKKYYKENVVSITAYKKVHATKYRVTRNAKEKLRRDTDILYRLNINLRNRIRKFFVGVNKSKSTLALIGCSVEQAKSHLEVQFKPGMSWENYGKWHVDHKYPLSLAKSKEELEKLCHYSNLQPLWGGDNIRKSNKVQ